MLVVHPFPLVKIFASGGSTADKNVKIYRQGMVPRLSLLLKAMQ